jgi:HAMP domain-containing protein
MADNTLKDVLPASSHQSYACGCEQTSPYKAGEFIDFADAHPGIAEGLQGRSGTVFVKHNGDEYVSAYSAVTPAGWVLVTEESWEGVSTPALWTSQLIPLLLVPAILIMSVALWFAARQIIRPLRILEAKAAKLAEGDFSAIRTSAGGIAEIQRLQYELVEMARKVQDAQRSLHGYIGSITDAQEEERRRLARELHDDTLQALIALKQRGS